MRKIKTLLIEDSGLMRIMVTDALRSDPDIEVVGTANNGKDGAAKARKLNPDVVVTDMMMPEYDGLFAVKEIMEKNPIPIILLSSLGKTTPEIFDALNAGAVDFIDKPQTKNAHEFKLALGELKAKIKIASGLNSEVLGKTIDRVNHSTHSFGSVLQYEILLIGASTGGPSAIESILAQLPENLAIPVVIAQHMPERFLVSYAQRLNSIVPLPVTMARRNDTLKPGTVYVAPGDGNMVITTNKAGQPSFGYSDKQYKEFNNPSVDCILESAAYLYKGKAVGVLLTGMGKDGAQGMLSIKEAGGLTIVQDAKSCVVNGMPKSAIEIGAVKYVVSLKEIPGFVMSCF